MSSIDVFQYKRMQHTRWYFCIRKYDFLFITLYRNCHVGGTVCGGVVLEAATANTATHKISNLELRVVQVLARYCSHEQLFAGL